ncbi:MBL fold metallo-hydrolase [Ralstonia sp. 25C]|uniref:MBL fold metallo-hydrolase n=1 Tax=Ralstonia sp. 25C TaxID=3447363 RepID=UPI003F753F7C
MVEERLADGVFAFYSKDARQLNAAGGAAATSGGLIVGTRSALMVETMLNKRLNGQVQALAKRVTDRPIAFAVNTSSHGDHSYGNMYMPSSTKIIQHEHTEEYIEHHLEDDKSFMVKNFGEGRGIEQIKVRPADILVPPGGKISIDLGGKKVNIIDFGFAQTGGDLFVWEPQSKTLWAGNAVVAPKPALPWLLDGKLVETLETLKRVHAFLPADARIIPGHGVAMTRDDLQWHIDYLSAVRSRVQGAIDHGLTLEQTVQQVTMPEFAGYTLFGWVHSGLNVPAAYKDLSKK